MKTYSKSIVFVLSILILSACAGNATPTQNGSLSDIYTAAAMTLSVPPSTSPATTTLMPIATSMVQVIPTLPLVTPTVQSAASYTSYSTANGCNDAIYVSDVTIPDGTVLAPGESFTKTWAFQNTGTCDWDEDFLIIFVSGTDMDGETTEIDQDVLSGSVGDISVSLVAPDTEGTYIGYWRMTDGDGNAFGQSVYVMIVVSDDAATVTPTATTTEEATATSEITSTSTPTSTPETTATFTSTPIPTETEAGSE